MLSVPTISWKPRGTSRRPADAGNFRSSAGPSPGFSAQSGPMLDLRENWSALFCDQVSQPIVSRPFAGTI
jgi:hypothetical protein